VRIAVLNSFGHIVGGVERYLDSSIPLLVEAGHEVCLWHEDGSTRSWHERPVINSPSTIVPIRSLRNARHDLDDIIASITQWMPDAICVHSMLDPKLERELLSIAPCVYFAHSYNATCISGSKTLHHPNPRPCARLLGPACLLHYYPDRCGGLNPAKALMDYDRSVRHLENARTYAAVIAFSSHMRDEYERHGIDSDKLEVIKPFTSAGRRSVAQNSRRELGDPVVIGFAGRLVNLKGVDFLLDALPTVQKALGKRLKLIVAGDGRARKGLERSARAIVDHTSGIEVEFIRWADDQQLDAFYATLNLLVVPSVWPEPFGMVGLEAAERGLPVAAFAVGGIGDWLRDGVNGHLARGDPPTVAGLSDAIVKCLRDPSHYESLCTGAVEVEAEYSGALHVQALTEILDRVQLQHA
jgi:glycosyltransferase involved in cell wall biosynthesis